MIRLTKKKEKKCSRCGDIVKSFSYGDYCSVCANEVWDRGFESTTQHAEEQYDQKMEKIEKINYYLNKAEINFSSILNMINAMNGVFQCIKCNKQRFTWTWYSDVRNEKRLKEILTDPCPKCKTIGFLRFKS